MPLRRRRGYLFERRFSAEPGLDPGALFERWLYLALNPVRAGLVAQHEDWQVGRVSGSWTDGTVSVSS